MDNQDPGGKKKNKKKKKQQSQETSGFDTQQYAAQFMNGPLSGAGMGLEHGGIGGKKPGLLATPQNKSQNARPHASEDFLLHPGQLKVSVAGGSRTVHQSPMQGWQTHCQGQQNPAHAQGQGQQNTQHGVERVDSNQKNAGGKAKAKAEQKGGKQIKDPGQQKGGSLKKDGGGEQGKASGQKSFKGKLRDENYDTVLRELASHRIFELRKRNLSFPNAKYFCRLCEYHLNQVEDCERHMDESRHQRKKEASDFEGILRHIPDPTPEQIKAIDTVLEEVVQREGLTSEELAVREDVVQRLQKHIKQFKPSDRDALTLQLFGSSLSGMGLKDSDVNIEVAGTGPGPKLLLEMYNILSKNGGGDFTNVQSDFQAKVPVVRLTDTQTGLKVVVAINAQMCLLTGTLLRLYCLADPRVRPLTVVLRSWAKICHLDRQEEGTLPPFAFGIMVIFFLLQIKPPVVCHLKKPKDETKEKAAHTPQKEESLDADFLKAKAEKWESKNKMTLGELWVRLLQFYCLKFDNTRYIVSIRQQQPVSRQEKKWHSKKLAIEDPFSAKKNLASSMANTLIFEYFQSSLRKAYSYFGLPRDVNGSSLVCIESLKQLASKRTDELLKENQEDPTKTQDEGETEKGKRSSKQSASASVKNLKKTESEEMDEGSEDGETVVIRPNRSIVERLKGVPSSRSNESSLETTVSDCDMTGDSFVTLLTNAASEAGTAASDSNITTDSVFASSGKVESEVDTDMDEAAVADMTYTDTQDESASAADVMSQNEEETCTDVLKAQNLEESLSSSDIVSGQASFHIELVEFAQTYVLKIVENAVKQLHLLDSLKQTEPSVASVSGEPRSVSAEEREVKVAESTVSKDGAKDKERPVEVEVEGGTSDASCFYKFTEDIFTGGKGPAVICGYCEKEGHIKANCPEDKLPSVDPLPAMTRKHMELLDQVICKVMYDFAPNELQILSRNKVVNDLEHFVQEIYPGAHFSLFGSSCNGFGFFSSDLDICMTLERKTLEDIDVTEIIEAVATKLMRTRGLYNVVAIPTAKVPIVKFADRNTKLEGDISLYNILAQRNTRLLRCYSQIDGRVQQLGYAVKVFAKICDIGDASRGSLSSYAFILMMLHYLQQCKPPLIPVLQELYPGKERPEVIVEGWNTWFFDNLPNLPKVWPWCGKNNQSPGELWLGFLRYYLEVFDWKGCVVTIRQKATLTKFEKLWNGQTIAVEDPFDLNHNLGGGLSRKMNNFIYKTFVNGRMHFGTPFERKMEYFNRFRSPEEYFFNINLLSDGKPPNDRGCRMCGKIGHMVKDCPQRQRKKANQQNQPKEKDKESSDKNTKNQPEQAANQPAGNSSKKGKVKGHATSQGKAASTPASANTAPSSSSADPNPISAASSATSTNSNTYPNTAPPGFPSTPTRTFPNASTPSHPASTPSPVSSSASRSSSGQSPVPGQHHQAAGSPSSQAPKTAQQGMHPPGIPLNIQQLFSMAQQQVGTVASLAPVQPQQIPTGLINPLQGFLSPEQQVALIGCSGGAGGGEAGGSSPKTGQPKPSPGVQMSENWPQLRPLMSLFPGMTHQQQQPPSRQQTPPQRHQQSPQLQCQQQPSHHLPEPKPRPQQLPPRQPLQQQQQQWQSPPQQAEMQQEQHVASLLQEQQHLQQQFQALVQRAAQQHDQSPNISAQLFCIMHKQQLIQQQLNNYVPPITAGSPAHGMPPHSVFDKPPVGSSPGQGEGGPPPAQQQHLPPLPPQAVHGQIPIQGLPLSQIPISGGQPRPFSGGQSPLGSPPSISSSASHGLYGSNLPTPGLFGPLPLSNWVFGQKPASGPPVSGQSPSMGLSSPVFGQPRFVAGPPIFQMAAPGSQGQQTGRSTPSTETSSPNSQKSSV